MTSVFNIISNKAKCARLYLELDPSGTLFAASILTVESRLFQHHSRSLEEVQNWAKNTLNDMYGAGKYALEPSEPAEREDYEKTFFQYFAPE
jgi:hypothetical protein